jgi:outer membrane biosynthesis protein TonB
VDSIPTFSNYPNYSFNINLQRTIGDSLEFPQEAIDANVNGRIYYSFIITAYGKVECVEVKRGLHPLLDYELIKVIRNMKIKKPAMKNGEYVNVLIWKPMSCHIQ